MKNKIKSICLSKTNILSVSFSIFFFLKDIEEVITGFASHLFLIGLSIIVLIGLLIINLFIIKNKNENAAVGDNTEIGNPNEDIDGINPNRGFQEDASSKNIKLSVAKIVFAIILFLALMTLGSLYYVKNMGVYYVVLKNDLTAKEAENLMKSTNNSYEFSTNGLSTRILPLTNHKYELILRNGYINEYKADSDLEKVKSLKLAFLPYKVGPTKGVYYSQKIKYLQHHIFN
jgi:hypothetical protein